MFASIVWSFMTTALLAYLLYQVVEFCTPSNSLGRIIAVLVLAFLLVNTFVYLASVHDSARRTTSRMSQTDRTSYSTPLIWPETERRVTRVT